LTDDDRAIATAATELISRYGEDARVIAVMKSAEAAAINDLEQSDFWVAVCDACEAAGTRH
jgi:hypothetical protein